MLARTADEWHRQIAVGFDSYYFQIVEYAVVRGSRYHYRAGNDLSMIIYCSELISHLQSSRIAPARPRTNAYATF